ncbi:MAG: molybdopterin-dependent oxidoreductase [Solirubrobacteraceae bacterium]
MSDRGAPQRSGLVDPGPAGSWSKPIGRRAVLSMLGLGGLGIVFGSDVQKGISGLLRSVHAGSVASLVPGGGEFVLYTITNGYPAAPEHYRLTVGGLVRRPLSLTLAELESLPATRLTRAFQCVTGWSVEDVHWVGVRLIDLAERASPLARASAFELTSFDGLYTESLTMQQARETGAIVAYSMLGAPVTREHGGPVRLYVPDTFGYKSIKWLSEIRLVARAKPGYWEQNGYPVNAWISGHPPRSAA